MPRPRLFVALDFPSADPARAMYRRLSPFHQDFKVGLELFTAAGPDFVRELVDQGAKIFLDLKFHDIPNTVAGAVRSSARLGVDYLNVHVAGGREMLRAAVAATAEESAKLGIARPRLLGVTVLTSLDDKAVAEVGFPRSASMQVKHFAELALECNLDGVVCSPQELPLIRALSEGKLETVVPGIRPRGADSGDQKRVLTPAEAAGAGATAMVVGRPVTGAPDPESALRNLLAELGT